MAAPTQLQNIGPQSITFRYQVVDWSRTTEQQISFILTAIQTDLSNLVQAINNHTHGGVTVGAGSTAVPNATAGTVTLPLTLQTLP